MKKKHSIQVRYRAFAIWQKLGFNPWMKKADNVSKESGSFYKGAFDSIPFLNKDAKRTFQHLLLRPGYMIRDYIRGDHENYLAPLTALIIFYAFFALVSSVLQPIQQDKKSLTDELRLEFEQEDSLSTGEHRVVDIAKIVQTGYTYLHLDEYPEAVDTQWESSLAALEATLRSQGIPLFLGEFFLLWFAMALSLRRKKIKMSACAAASAYVLCQFSFFMLFAVILTFGKSTSISVLLMFALLVLDYRQWLELSWKKSIGRAVSTGLWYGLLYTTLMLLISAVVLLIAFMNF
ncbi:MAG: DUF3667 domain-containing protein [Bacteroidales bacterium]|nr:DUF3667 domain-containing protein [Bacteroidales bacterium]